MRQIPIGTTGRYELVLGTEHLASSANPLLPQVMATPMMILMMEQAAMSAIVPYLDAGETSVGMLVNVEHLAATPIGHAVRAEAEVVKSTGGASSSKSRPSTSTSRSAVARIGGQSSSSRNSSSACRRSSSRDYNHGNARTAFR